MMATHAIAFENDGVVPIPSEGDRLVFERQGALPAIAVNDTQVPVFRLAAGRRWFRESGCDSGVCGRRHGGVRDRIPLSGAATQIARFIRLIEIRDPIWIGELFDEDLSKGLIDGIL